MSFDIPGYLRALAWGISCVVSGAFCLTALILWLAITLGSPERSAGGDGAPAGCGRSSPVSAPLAVPLKPNS